MLNEDQNKVMAKVRELNNSGGDWIPLQGFNAITTAGSDPISGKLQFNPAVGLPVKIFINRTNGEVRIFNWQQFV